MSRRAGWLSGPIEHALVCPLGHRQDAARFVIGSQVVQCRHQASRHGPRCGALMWVDVTLIGRTFVASITHAEIVELKAHRDPFQAIAFLDLPLWKPAA